MQSNGRVNILNYNPHDRFQLHDKIPTGQSTSYHDALIGNWQNNTLSNTFFSAENIRILQNGLKAGVYNESNGRFIIGDQDEDTLKIIMRSIFLQHAANQKNNITGQVQHLNTLVLATSDFHYLPSNLCSTVQQYHPTLHYLCILLEIR